MRKPVRDVKPDEILVSDCFLFFVNVSRNEEMWYVQKDKQQ